MEEVGNNEVFQSTPKEDGVPVQATSEQSDASTDTRSQEPAPEPAENRYRQTNPLDRYRQQPGYSRSSAPAGSGNGPHSSNAAELVKSIEKAYSERIVGQEELFESVIVSLLSGGHLLIEGVPGLAKTTAAHSIASAIGADFVRIQCTPDMLPSDIIGTQIFNQQKHEFTTQLGPINHQFVLVDEINRTSAKTQSALLEAMQERQVSIGGKTYPLPRGFIVLATQNPIEQEGTYPLPEAQLDRFLLKHVIDYPTIEDEVSVLKSFGSIQGLKGMHAVASTGDLLRLQREAEKITVDDRILQYIATVVAVTRNPERYGLSELKQFIEVGASPRASIALLSASRALALISNGGYVTPDHVKPFLARALRHRIVLTYEAEAENVKIEDIINKIGSFIQVP